MEKQQISARGINAPEAKKDWKDFNKYPNPFFHVFVAAGNGYCWGCFGRGISEVPDAGIICKGRANLEWVMEIACVDCQRNPRPCSTGEKCYGNPCAGVTHTINGICHSCANRLLLPAGIDVADSPGNEIATFLFGKYGFGMTEFIKRLTIAAERANERNPEAVSSDDLNNAIKAIKRREQDEHAILLEDIDNFLKVKVPELADSIQDQIAKIHQTLYQQRIQTYDQYQKTILTAAQHEGQQKQHAFQAFKTIEKELGLDNVVSIFGVQPDVAVSLAFER